MSHDADNFRRLALLRGGESSALALRVGSSSIKPSLLKRSGLRSAAHGHARVRKSRSHHHPCNAARAKSAIMPTTSDVPPRLGAPIRKVLRSGWAVLVPYSMHASAQITDRPSAAVLSSGSRIFDSAHPPRAEGVMRVIKRELPSARAADADQAKRKVVVPHINLDD